MKENEMKSIAEIINSAITNAENESKLDALVNNVKDLCSGFPLYKDIL
jgi:glycine/serine hydroxymethyltransferase